mmetsp:Transcript_66766/g.147978  ORF Transcript_66766/g.147978 Transcript_66766/m.147978 type:complete len:257 (-) Transcript_66766:14-784(-)
METRTRRRLTQPAPLHVAPARHRSVPCLSRRSSVATTPRARACATRGRLARLRMVKRSCGRGPTLRRPPSAGSFRGASAPGATLAPSHTDRQSCETPRSRSRGCGAHSATMWFATQWRPSAHFAVVRCWMPHRLSPRVPALQRRRANQWRSVAGAGPGVAPDQGHLSSPTTWRPKSLLRQPRYTCRWRRWRTCRCLGQQHCRRGSQGCRRLLSPCQCGRHCLCRPRIMDSRRRAAFRHGRGHCSEVLGYGREFHDL